MGAAQKICAEQASQIEMGTKYDSVPAF